MLPCWCKCELQSIPIVQNLRIIVTPLGGKSYPLARRARWLGWQIPWHHQTLQADWLHVENGGSSEMLVCQDKISTACSFYSSWGAGWHETSAALLSSLHHRNSHYAPAVQGWAHHSQHTQPRLGLLLLLLLLTWSREAGQQAQLHLCESRWGW